MAGEGVSYCIGPHSATSEECKANVAFIVKACNAHDELYDALSGLLGFCQLLRCNDLPANVCEALESNHRIIAARDALAKVESP